MGTKLGSILTSKEIANTDLNGKSLAIDAYNMLYQFITTIRQYDGTPLMDSKGNITSHLSGLFFRTANLMQENMKLAFVFDGKTPELKQEERDRRKAKKMEAQRKYEKAVDEGDVELMKKYASRTARLTGDMVIEAKELIAALGLPVVQAPAEGEAQAAYMVQRGDFYGLISQDTDGLLFGSSRIIKNLSITGRRKRGASYHAVEIEVIELAENLNNLGIDRDQLIVLAMLSGTDFNVGGIKGIGPKKGIKLVKKHGKDFGALFKEAGWDEYFDYPWKKVFDTIKHMPTTDDYQLQWDQPDYDTIRDIMITRHEFGEDRIQKVLDDLQKEQAQTGLSDFF